MTYAISIAIKDKLQLNISKDISCSEIADMYQQLILIETELNQIKKSYFERISIIDSEQSNDDKRMKELKQSLATIIKDDIQRIKIIEEILKDLSISINVVKQVKCQKKMEIELLKVKNNLTSFVQEMNTKLTNI